MSDVRQLMSAQETSDDAGARAGIVAGSLDLSLKRLREVVKTLGKTPGTSSSTYDLVHEALQRLETSRGLLHLASEAWPAMNPANTQVVVSDDRQRA